MVIADGIIPASPDGRGSVTHAVMRRTPELVEAYPDLAARDLVHVATCLQEGIRDIVSPDRGFDRVAAIRRIDPAAGS